MGKRRTDDKEGVGHSQKPKVKTLEGALRLMREMDMARLVGKHVAWRTARSYQITDGRGENTGGSVCVGTRIRVNPSHRKGTGSSMTVSPCWVSETKCHTVFPSRHLDLFRAPEMMSSSEQS